MTPLTLSIFNRDLKRQLSALRPRLYRIAYSWCHNPELADDLVQETMVKALKNLHQAKSPDDIGGWLFGILGNCWRDHFRKLRPAEDIDNIVLVDEITPAHSLEQQNIVDKVRHAVTSLPTGQCQVMTLVDLEGFSYSEVARILNIPIGTVMSRLCRARNSLSEKLLDLRPSDGKDTLPLRRIK